jgi:Protein of unknown function (DUF2510)
MASPGWYPDPDDHRGWRWWDGQEWGATDQQFATEGRQATRSRESDPDEVRALTKRTRPRIWVLWVSLAAVVMVAGVGVTYAVIRDHIPSVQSEREIDAAFEAEGGTEVVMALRIGDAPADPASVDDVGRLLRQRIDELGVTEALIVVREAGDHATFTIRVPGVQDARLGNFLLTGSWNSGLATPGLEVMDVEVVEPSG